MGVGVEKWAVSFEMNQSTIAQDIAVKTKETSAGEAFAHLFHLRVGEGNPYLTHFVFGKETIDEFDVGAKECHIAEPQSGGLSGTGPHACSFAVDSDIVFVGEAACEPHGIFALAATQLEHYGIGVMKIFLIPLASEWKRFVLKACKRILEHTLQCFHFRKFLKFVFTHFVKKVMLKTVFSKISVILPTP